MQSYVKYEFFYDKKARTSSLQEKVNCYILQLKTYHQGRKDPFRDFRWIGLYINENVIENKN